MTKKNGQHGTDVLRTYDDDYLDCRFGRHAMKTDGFYREGGAIVTLMHCMRCPVTATAITNARTGRPMRGRKYEYPDDYRIVGGVELRHVRLERFRRAVANGEMREKP